MNAYYATAERLGVNILYEGEDFWPKRYAIWGRLVAAQPDQIAYSIIDAISIDLFMPSVFPPIEADTIPAMADSLGLDPDALEQTVSTFNAAVTRDNFDPAALDDCRTNGRTVSLITALSVVTVILLTVLFQGRDVLFGLHAGEGAFSGSGPAFIDIYEYRIM